MIGRSRRGGPDPFLDWKVRILVVGGVLLVTGIFLDRRELVGAAVLVLASSLVLGIVQRMRERRDEGDAAEDEAGDPDD
jgi:hypothetical protein